MPNVPHQTCKVFHFYQAPTASLSKLKGRQAAYSLIYFVYIQPKP